MSRIVPLVMLVCAGWIASDFGRASAQSVTLPECSPKSNERRLRQGGFPNWVGCRFSDAQKVLERFEYRAVDRPDEATSGIERGFITRQSRDGGEIVFDVTTGAGYPPPAPPPPIITPPPGQALPPPPTEGILPPKFSILAPTSVAEGRTLTLTVHREGNDGRPHRIELSADRPELLMGPLASFEFDPGKTDQVITVETAVGKPGDGDQTLEISLTADDSAQVGNPQSASITITDTPPATYEIFPPEGAERGQTLTFRVERKGAQSPSELEFEIRQGAELKSPDGLPHPLRFAANQPSRALELRPDFYSECGPPPTLILRDSSGRAVSATASFSGPPPSPQCGDRRTLLQRLNDDSPWWPIPVVLVALAAIAYTIRRIWPSPPQLYPSWSVEAGPPPDGASAPRLPDWPKFSTRSELEWGGSIVPERLPVAEVNDD